MSKLGDRWRRRECFTCDHPGCQSTFPLVLGVRSKAPSEARKLGWSLSPKTGRVFCPQHRKNAKLPKITNPPKITKPPRIAKPKRESPWPARLPQIIAAREAGRGLQSIGEDYGVTHECVRLHLKRAGIATKRKKKPPAPRCFNGAHVRRWLAECGYRWCSAGKHVACAATFVGNSRRCRECNVRVTNAYYHKKHPNAKYRAASLTPGPALRYPQAMATASSTGKSAKMSTKKGGTSKAKPKNTRKKSAGQSLPLNLKSAVRWESHPCRTALSVGQ